MPKADQSDLRKRILAAYTDGFAPHAAAYLRKYGNTARYVKAWAFKNNLDPTQFKKAVRSMAKYTKKVALVFSETSKTAANYIDDEWRQVLETNGWYPSGAAEERWIKSGFDFYVAIDHEPEGEPFFVVRRNTGEEVEKSNDTWTLEIYTTDKVVEQAPEPQYTDEEIAEKDKKFLRDVGIKGSKTAEFASKTAKTCECGHPISIHTHPPDFGCPHEKDGCGCKGATDKIAANTSNNIFINGGWFDSDGTAYPLEGSQGHDDAAMAFGLASKAEGIEYRSFADIVREAINNGNIRFNVWSRQKGYSFEVKNLNNRNELIDIIAQLSENIPIQIEWGGGLDRDFENKDTAIDWLENRTITAGPLNRLLLPAALLGLGMGGTSAGPASTPREPAAISQQQQLQQQRMTQLEQRQEQQRVTLEQLAHAVARAEGAHPDLHNPGNLVDFNSGKIRRFKSDEKGMNALKRQLKRIITGQNPNFDPNMSLKEMGMTYSNGDPNWAKNVSQILKVDLKTPIGKLVKLAGAWGERSYDNDDVQDLLDNHRTPSPGHLEQPVAPEQAKKLLKEMGALGNTMNTPEDYERYFGVMVFLTAHGIDIGSLHRNLALEVGQGLAEDEAYLKRWKNPLLRKAKIEEELQLFNQSRKAAFVRPADFKGGNIEEQVANLMEKRAFNKGESGDDWTVYSRNTEYPDDGIWLKVFFKHGTVSKVDMFDQVPEQVIETRRGFEGLFSFAQAFGD